MRRFEEIENAIAERWGSDPAVQLCQSILEFAASKSCEQNIMLTFSDLKDITGATYLEENLQLALTILVSRYSALEMRFVYLDGDNEPIYLDDEEQKSLISSGMLIHPESGQKVDNASEKVFPYYIAIPSQLLKEVSA